MHRIVLFSLMLTACFAFSAIAGQIPGAAPGVTSPMISNNHSGGFFVPELQKSSSSADFVYATTTYTFADLIVFSYFDGSEFSVLDGSGNILDTQTLDADQYYVFSPGNGVYRVEGTNSFTLLIGDPVTNSVMGYFAVDESGRPVSTRLNSYMPRSSWGGEHFIVFAYQDNTSFLIKDLSSGTTVAAGVLNAGEHYQLDNYYNVFLGVFAGKPVSALSYTDQGYYIPATNGTFTGTHFYGFSGIIGGWYNGVIVTAYNDNTTYTVVNTETGTEIASGTLMAGESTTDYVTSDTYWEVTTSKPATVCNTPYAYWTSNYYYLTRQIDETGLGIGTNFYAPAIGGNMNIFSYDDNNEITIYDQTNATDIATITLNAGEGYEWYNPKSVYHIQGTGNLAVITSYGGGYGADFMPLNFALGLPDVAISSDDIYFTPASTNPTPGNPVTINVNVNNYGFATAHRVGLRLFDGDPDGGLPIGALSVVDSIQAGASYTFQIPWTVPTNPGYHAVYAVVDPFDEVNESNNSNNVAHRFLIDNDDLLPPLSVSIDAPSGVPFENGLPVEGYFEVRADVFNTGTVYADNASIELTLPAEISIYSGNSSVNFGSLAPGYSASYTWYLQIDDVPASGDAYFYSFTVRADNAPTKVVERMFQVNPLDVPTVGVSLVQNSAFTNFAEIYMTTNVALAQLPTVRASMGTSFANLPVGAISNNNFGSKVFFTGSGTMTLEMGLTSLFGPYAEYTETFGVQLARPDAAVVASSPENDFRLFVPENAVSQETYLTVFKPKATMDDENLIPGSEMQFGPADLRSEKEFVITLDYSTLMADRQGDVSYLKIYRSDFDGWTELSSFIDREAKTLTARTSQLGMFKVGYGETQTEEMPTTYALEQNYPNPFNPETRIHFTLANAEPQPTRLVIYNSLGEKIRTVLNGSLGFGVYDIKWDGRNDGGRAVASGVYFYQLRSGDFTATQKMVLVR